MEQGIRKTQDQTQALNDETRSPGKDLPIKGRFTTYDSPFVNLMVSVLTMRYLWLAVEDINPFDFLKKNNHIPKLLKDGSKNPEYVQWKNPPPIRYLSRNFAAHSIGATVMGILGFYTKRTNDDIKTL